MYFMTPITPFIRISILKFQVLAFSSRENVAAPTLPRSVFCTIHVLQVRKASRVLLHTEYLHHKPNRSRKQQLKFEV